MGESTVTDQTPSRGRQATAEAADAFFLMAPVVGSGFTGEALAGGNVAIVSLGNTVATAAILMAIIGVFGPVAG